MLQTITKYSAALGSAFVKRVCAIALALSCLFSSHAAFAAASLDRDCYAVLRERMRETFNGPADEKNYTSLYLSCWAQAVVTGAKNAPRSYLGKGLQLFGNPAFVEASGFSKNLCAAANRKDYPCWFEQETAVQDVSLEAAAKKEVPKILFSDVQKARDGTDVVQFVLCTNDDPTKPKEYSKGCKRGYRATITEYGRGDFNGDNVEDMMLTVKFGNNADPSRRCYMASFTRKDNDYFKLLQYSWIGPCE